ncbi:MAG: hypothetical protein R3D63_13500 [Paracoccaceae bacterium]
MKILPALAALFLALLPGFALAEGCGHAGDKSAMSCAEGHVWDEARGTCVLQPSS